MPDEMPRPGSPDEPAPQPATQQPAPQQPGPQQTEQGQTPQPAPGSPQGTPGSVPAQPGQTSSTVDAKFCVECGTQMSLNQKGEWFCPKCGFKLETKVPGKLSPEEERKQKIRLYIKLLIYFIGGLFAIFAVYFFFTKFKVLMDISL